MRNLTLISSWHSSLPSSTITATTIDLDENVIYVASEHTALDGQLEVGVWRMSQLKSSWVKFHRNMLTNISISNRFQVFSRADFNISNGTFLEWTKQWRDHIFSVHGRIATYCCYYAWGRFHYDLSRWRRHASTGSFHSFRPFRSYHQPQFEVEGSFESGILAASWSPDESVVAIVTGEFDLQVPWKNILVNEAKGEHKLILLTSLFDVLSEKPLHVEDFGEGTLPRLFPDPICWGFHQMHRLTSVGALSKLNSMAPLERLLLKHHLPPK